MNKKITQILVGVITLLLVAALAFWAGRTTLKPPERITQTGAETMTVTVTEQNIGRTLTPVSYTHLTLPTSDLV